MSFLRWLILASFLIAGIIPVLADDSAPVPVANQKQINPSDILAQYDGGVITRQDLENKISKIPANSQSRYRTVEGQIQVLDIMVLEEAFWQKSLQLGMDKDPDVLVKIATGTRQYFIQEYYKRNVGDKVTVTDDDKLNYYNNNKQAFYMFPYLSISYIQAADEASANLALQQLRAGVTFATVSDSLNINSYAKGLKGVIKNIRLNGNIPGVGNDLDLEKFIAESKADSTVYYGPIHTATGWHIFRTNEYVPGKQKTYEEVLPELDQRTRPGVETRLLNALTERLKTQYAVVVDTTLIAQINLSDRAKNSAIEDVSIVSSSSPDVLMTVRNLLDSYAKISPQEQLYYSKGEGVKDLLNQELLRSLFYADAKAQNYEQVLADNADYQQMRRYNILNKTFRQLVVDSIQVSSEESRAYYDEHIAEFATPAYRSIQVLYFDKETNAERILKKYNRFVKLGDEDRINELIEKNSIKPTQSTLDNLYNNGVITGIGPDDAFSKMIWNNPVGYVSPVFKSTKGDILFFRTMKETPPGTQNFTEIEPRIYGTLKGQRQTSQQDKVTQELFTEFHMEKFPEKLKLELSAEELFNMADTSSKQRNFKDAITFYDQIIKSYPNGTDDYRASFMKAFIVAEELKDDTQALQLFKDFLKKYPTGELNDSAQFMIDSLSGNNTIELPEEPEE
jgi:peptidyl-prolyl cis-trans isomerase C